MSNKEVRASSKLESVAPANTNRIGSLPTPFKRTAESTSRQPTKAPAWATYNDRLADEAPKSNAKVTAKALPALTPSKPGSAKGLRARVCINAPAHPSAMPVTRPTKVRGARNSNSTKRASSVPAPHKTLRACHGVVSPAPNNKLARLVSNNKAAQPSSSVGIERRWDILFRLRLCDGILNGVKDNVGGEHTIGTAPNLPIYGHHVFIFYHGQALISRGFFCLGKGVIAFCINGGEEEPILI